MSKTIIGIDLGTTYSLAAVMQAGAPVVIPNVLGEALTPSAVSATENGELLVGAAARARAAQHPLSTALAFKRDMGTERTYSLGKHSLTAPMLSALVLGSLKRDAEAFLGQQVEEAVVTVPAYFGDLQRQATKDAGRLAGLKVERIINEPTAAALAYGLHHRAREHKVVVLDLGGGTFDVTVLELIEGVIEVTSTAGDARLGGDDFDDALAELVVSRLKNEALKHEPQAWARLRMAAELAKRRLSSEAITRVVLPGMRAGGKTFELDEPISREQAEDAWRGLLERVRGPILRALGDAQLKPSAVDEVLLVGGSTRMPCMAALAAQLFGRLPLRTLPPDEAVAMGAAVQAALKSGDKQVDDLVVTDVAPFSLGIATGAVVGKTLVNGIFSPLIERGTVIPCSRVDRFAPLDAAQTQIRLEVFQGEHAQCSRNQFLGEYLVKDLPPGRGPASALDVRFTYDLNGILEVEMTRVASGNAESFIIERRPGSLSSKALEKAVQAMKGLKLHPRDALPNTTALLRAEALYAELTGAARSAMGEEIAAFRGALEGQNPEEITRAREQLIAATGRLERR